MAISEDGSTPAAATATGFGPSATTASFSPPAGALLVAIVSYGHSTATPTITLSDSGSHTWTAGPSITSNVVTTAAIFTCQLTTAPGSITVTAAITSGASTGEIQLDVRVVKGAATSQTGAATGTNSGASTTAWSGSITTTISGSWVYVAANGANTNTLTPVSGTTTLNTFTSTDDMVSGRQSSATGTPGATTLGWTATVNATFAWAALEILPQGYVPPPAGLTVRQAVKRSHFW